MTIYESYMFYSGVYRLLVFLTGMFSIYLGYKLFKIKLEKSCVRNVVESDSSELKIQYKLTSLFLKSNTPGIFFALFGSMLISIMIVAGSPELQINTINDFVKTQDNISEPNASIYLKGAATTELQAIVNRYYDGYFDDDPAFGLKRIVEILNKE